MQRPRTRITSLSDSPSLQLYKLEITTAASEGKLEIDPGLTGLPGLRSLISTFNILCLSGWESLRTSPGRESGAYSPGTRTPKYSLCAARYVTNNSSNLCNFSSFYFIQLTSTRSPSLADDEHFEIHTKLWELQKKLSIAELQWEASKGGITLLQRHGPKPFSAS